MSTRTTRTEHNATQSTEFQWSLYSNGVERRRQNAAADPALMVGTIVFAQMVAADLARDAMAQEAGHFTDAESGEDTENSLAQAEILEGDGLFGEMMSNGTIVPIAAGAALAGRVPGSGSDAASVLAKPDQNTGESAAAEGDDQGSGSNSSYILRSASALQNGGQPDPDGAREANPTQEASAAQSTAQSTAADAPQQFAGAGSGSPFGAGVPPAPVNPMPAEREPVTPAVDASTPASPMQNAAVPASGDAASSQADTGMVAASSAQPISSSAWADGVGESGHQASDALFALG